TGGQRRPEQPAWPGPCRARSGGDNPWLLQGGCRQCSHQPLSRALRRLWTHRGESQQRGIGAQRLQFPTAVGARRQMHLQIGAGFSIERADSVQRQVFRELVMVLHANAFRTANNAERILVFTVPSGSPVFAAISVWVMPSKNAISSVRRCSAGSPA